MIRYAPYVLNKYYRLSSNALHNNRKTRKAIRPTTTAIRTTRMTTRAMRMVIKPRGTDHEKIITPTRTVIRSAGAAITPKKTANLVSRQPSKICK